MITMAIGGMWHGANWTFLIWGLLHGIGVAASQLLRRHAPLWMRPPRWVLILVTFHVVALLWVLFRAPDISTASPCSRAVWAERPSRAPPRSSPRTFLRAC